MLHIVSYTLMKIYGINKKGTLGTTFLDGFTDIMDLLRENKVLGLDSKPRAGGCRPKGGQLSLPIGYREG